MTQKKTMNQIRVMTMNLRFGLAPDGENSWENRKHLVGNIVEKYSGDFLGVQEANHFQTRFLNQCLGEYRSIGWFNKSNDSWQSNLVFFHPSWKCLKSEHFFLSDTPKKISKMPGSKWPRQCVIGWFEKENHQVLVANTHFDFNSRVQEKSAGLVMDFLSGFQKDLPVIITGDFNCNPGSPAHKAFKTCGFKEVFEDQPKTTFHEFKGTDTGKHIDWILFKGPIQKVSCKVIQDSFSGRFPSDHYPVQAGFEWESKSPDHLK